MVVQQKGIYTVCYGTTEEWKQIDPVLEAGEIGFDTELNNIKIGDGSSHWTELNYVSVNVSDFAEYLHKEFAIPISGDYITAQLSLGEIKRRN